MDPDEENATIPGETWTRAEPHEGGDHLHATGLEDYAYWLRWSRSLPPQDATAPKPFRRGIIWR